MPIYADGSAAPVTASMAGRVVSVTSSVIAPVNLERRNLSIYNEGPEAVYVAFGLTAMTTEYTAVIPAGGYMEVPVTYSNNRARPYAGNVSAVTAADTATIMVTEF